MFFRGVANEAFVDRYGANACLCAFNPRRRDDLGAFTHDGAANDGRERDHDAAYYQGGARYDYLFAPIISTYLGAFDGGDVCSNFFALCDGFE